MRFLRRHWYEVGAIIALGAGALLVLGWQDMGILQRLLLLNYIALLVHQFEEYAWPGGEPWIINEVMQPKGGPPDRYPLNQNNAFFMNVPLAWSFYLLPVFFPGMVWLGLAPVLFGLGQFIGHGIANNGKLKTVYNPGLAAVVLGHVPLGIWYLVAVYSRGMIRIWDWVFAMAYIGCFVGVGMLKIGYGLLANKVSSYPFAPEEMERFDRRGHLARIGRSGIAQESGAAF